MENKICYKCNIEYPISNFNVRKNKRKDGSLYLYYHRLCKPCHRQYNNLWTKNNKHKRNIKAISIKYNYGMDFKTYLNLKNGQENKCAICGYKASDVGMDVLHIDHCHTTNKVRGLLCKRCNQGIGLLRDNPNFMVEAIYYLNNSRGEILNCG